MGFLGGLGMWELLLILAVVLFVFGAKRIPEIGRSLGRAITEFRGVFREIRGELEPPEDED